MTPRSYEQTSADAQAGTTRIAIVGCGFIGTVHSFALRAVIRGGLVDADVVATCDVELEKAQRMLEPHRDDSMEARGADDSESSAGGEGGGKRVATVDIDEALDDVDVAWVCTPTVMHEEVVERCVAHGVAIYCEKPLARDLSGAERISSLVDGSGLPNQVGLVLRAAPPFASIAALSRGEAVVGGPIAESLGLPLAVVLRDDQYFPIGGMYGSDWRGDVAVAGGGTLLEHSIHDLDLLVWMLGPAVSVVARTQNHAGHPGIEDVAAVTLEHSSGALSTLLSVWHGIKSRPSTRRLEVFFERGHAVLENEQVGPVRVEQAEATTEIGLPGEAAGVMDRLAVPSELRPHLLAYASADLGFLHSVRSGQPPSPGVGIALVAHRVVDAAYRSAELGGMPQIPGDGRTEVLAGG